MNIEHHHTSIEIEGYVIPCRVKYEGQGDDLEIWDIQVQGEDKLWLSMPLIPVIDEVFKQEIWENV